MKLVLVVLAAVAVVLARGHVYECHHDDQKMYPTFTVPTEGNVLNERPIEITFDSEFSASHGIYKLLHYAKQKTQHVVNVHTPVKFDLPSHVSTCGPSPITEKTRMLMHNNEATDLLVIVTHNSQHEHCVKHPEAFAAADACGFDRFGRPTVGFLNFCQKSIIVNEETKEETLHHLMHIVLFNRHVLQSTHFKKEKQMTPASPNVDYVIASGTVQKMMSMHFQCKTTQVHGIAMHGSHIANTHFFGELMTEHNKAITDRHHMRVLSYFTLAIIHDSTLYSVREIHRRHDRYSIGWIAGCAYLEHPNPGLVAATVDPKYEHKHLNDIMAHYSKKNQKPRRLMPDTLTSSDHASLVTKHNLLRADLAGGAVTYGGKTWGPASNIELMSGNSALASSAEQHVQNSCAQGVTGHDSGSARQASAQSYGWTGGYVGQNLAYGYPASYYNSLNALINFVQSWWDEYQGWTYSTIGSSGTCDQTVGGSKWGCGHFTQVAWAVSNEVGCGIAVGCSGSYQVYLGCNYGPGGNYGGQYPYKQGTRCSQCSTSRQTCQSSTSFLCAAGVPSPTTGPAPTTGPPPTTAPAPTPRPTPRPTTPTAAPPTGGSLYRLGVTLTMTLQQGASVTINDIDAAIRQVLNFNAMDGLAVSYTQSGSTLTVKFTISSYSYSRAIGYQTKIRSSTFASELASLIRSASSVSAPSFTQTITGGPNGSTNTNGNNGVSTGIIIGLVIGIAVLVGLLIFASWRYCKVRQQNNNNNTPYYQMDDR